MPFKYLPTLLLVIVSGAGSMLCAAQDSSDYPAADATEDQNYQAQQGDDFRNDENRSEHRFDDHRHNDGSNFDAQLHERVHRALWQALGRQARNISVQVSRRNVYLAGSVDNWQSRRYAHQVAHGVRGVREVNYDGLRVRRGY